MVKGQIERFEIGDGNSESSPKQGKQYIKWDFTYNNYEFSEIERLEILFRSLCVKFVFQQEDAGTPHLQGAVAFPSGFRKRLTELVKIFGKGISWRPARNWNCLVLYCQDIDKRIPNGLVVNYNCVKPRKPIKILKIGDLYTWEKKIVDIIMTEPNDRTIYWFYEYEGNVGKSTFAKYLCVVYKALILGGCSKDMKYGIVKYIDKHGDYPEIIILDVPRTSQGFVSYKGIEQIKNACFFSGKFESDMVLGNCPHVIVFANFKPNTQKMSDDRWYIENISNSTLSDIGD